MTTGRQRFLKCQRSGISGNDVAAVMGISPYKTPYRLWQEKTQKIKLADEKDTDQLHFDSVLKEIIAQEFSRRHEFQVQRRNRLYRKDIYLVANIDRYIVSKAAVLECKIADKFTRNLWGKESTNDIPVYCLTQLQYYMYVTGYKDSYLAVLIGDNEYHDYHIVYNADLAELLAERCINFWEKYVNTDTPPPAIDNKDILSMYNAAEGLSITANKHIVNAVKNLKKVRQEQRVLEDKEIKLEFEIKNYMSESDILLAPDGNKLATWKESASNHINAVSLQKKLPNVAELFSTQTITREFLLI